MQQVPFITAFRIAFDYQGRRMAKVKHCPAEIKHCYDCTLFEDNVIRIHYDGHQWVETFAGENTAMAAALGKAIKDYIENLNTTF